jgi:hypothetical protein
VKSLVEMEDRDFGRHSTRFDQRRVLQCADRTKTSRADVATSIAFDTFPELLHPILKAFFLRQALNLREIGEIFRRSGRFALLRL